MKKIFCVGYAGSLNTYYYKWNNYLPEKWKLINIKLKGRDSKELYYSNLTECIQHVYSQIIDELEDNCEYFIFGHSMGSIITYEVTLLLIKNKKRLPKFIVVSGKNPLLFEDDWNISNMNDIELIKFLENLRGEIIPYQDVFVKYFLPIIKNDLMLIQNYKLNIYHAEFEPIDIDILVLNGNEDNMVNKDRLYYWNKLTKKLCDFYFFEGNHFYLDSNLKEIIEVIKSKSERRE